MAPQYDYDKHTPGNGFRLVFPKFHFDHCFSDHWMIVKRGTHGYDRLPGTEKLKVLLSICERTLLILRTAHEGPSELFWLTDDRIV